ncbi:NACHT domain-containing protein [Streptomyces jumonjinensis]|uniref:NACHT domain-containing protein n=1 Tax=Streptomyces jumonjinensis TaxID=1945 RepID=A0A646K924_STRJU|nr:NACHT domain-containing protein [Streptomyces jumonjinensis]MQS98644.1 NACHT domain-containing protein [Streptomyces jumonjinensis]
MDASAAVAVRLASAAVAPLVKRLFVREGPGARLVEEPVRISGLVSFGGLRGVQGVRGEKNSLGEQDLRKLTAELVARALRSYGPHDGPDDAVRAELADALALALHSLGDLAMDDVQAVRLGPGEFAGRLARPVALSADAEPYYGPLLDTACLHILNFFTQRSHFVARTLVEQTRSLDRLVAIADLLAERVPSQRAEDTRFEQRYTEHITRKHSELTIYGLDLAQAREWRLDSAYVSLEAVAMGDTAVPLPAERALAGRDKVLLRGGAGSGKTTLVQWLAVAAARQDYDELGEHLTHLIGRLPFVLPLRRIIRDGLPPTPDDFLRAVRSAVAGAQPDGWADRVLRAGRALLLVDGIDEIPRREREETRRWLRELMGEFPGNLWLVTARSSAVGEDWLAGDGFTELTLSPMSRDDVTRFVRRWHTAAGADPALADALLGAIRTSADLGGLAVNPLMCGLLCALHRERRGFLPHGRRDLYDAALRMLLERRDTERGIAPGDGLRLSSETQTLLLQKLAHWLIRNDSVEMERADALTQLGRALEYMAHVDAPVDRVLRHLLERSGLLREPAPERIDFVHRTFQDYLGAKALVEEGDFPLLLKNAYRDQWEDVVRMAVALGRPAERERILRGLVAGVDPQDLIRRLGRTGAGTDPEWALRRVLLAATCLEHATEIAPGIRRHIEELVSSFVPPNGSHWARVLAEQGGPRVLGLLPGPEGLTEQEALHVVVTAARIGTDAALPVIARFREHSSLRVRRQLTWSWSKFDTRQYADEVLAHLDQGDLYFTAHNVEHLDALRAMGGRARIQLTRAYPPESLVRLIDTERLTHLWLHSARTQSDSLAWLSAFPRLEVLVLPATDVASRLGIPGHITVIDSNATAKD